MQSSLLVFLASLCSISCIITSARDLEQYLKGGNKIDSGSFSLLEHLNEVILNESLLALLPDDILSTVSIDHLNEASIRNITAREAKYISKGCDANILLMNDAALQALNYESCVESALLQMQDTQSSFAIQIFFARLSSNQLSKSWQMLNRASLCSFLPASFIIDIYNDNDRRGALKSISSDCFANLRDIIQLPIEPTLFHYLPEHLWKSVPLLTFSHDSLRNIPSNLLKSLQSSCDVGVLYLEEDQLSEIPLSYILDCAEKLSTDDFNSLIVRLPSSMLKQILAQRAEACAKIRASTLEEIVNSGMQSTLMSMTSPCLRSLIDFNNTNLPSKVLNSLPAEVLTRIPFNIFSSDTLSNFGPMQVSGINSFSPHLGLLPEELIEFMDAGAILSSLNIFLSFRSTLQPGCWSFLVKLFTSAMKKDGEDSKFLICNMTSSVLWSRIFQSPEALHALPSHCVKKMFSMLNQKISPSVSLLLNPDIISELPMDLFSEDTINDMDISLLRLFNEGCSAKYLEKMSFDLLYHLRTNCFFQAFSVEGYFNSDCSPDVMKVISRKITDDLDFCTHIRDASILSRLISSGLGDYLRDIPMANLLALSRVWNKSEFANVGLLRDDIFESVIPNFAVPLLSKLRPDQVQLMGRKNPNECLKLRRNLPQEAENFAPHLNIDCFVGVFSILYIYLNIHLIPQTIVSYFDGESTISIGKEHYNVCQIFPARVFSNLLPFEYDVLPQVSSSCLSMMPGIETFDLSGFLPYMRDDIFDLVNRGIGPETCKSLEVRHVSYINSEKNAKLCASIDPTLLNVEVLNELLKNCGENLGKGHLDCNVKSEKEYALEIRISEGFLLQKHEIKLLETEYQNEVNQENFPSILALIDTENSTINISSFANDVLGNISSILPSNLLATVRPEQMTDLLCMNYTKCQWDVSHFPNFVPLPEQCLLLMKEYEDGVVEELKRVVQSFIDTKNASGDELFNTFNEYEGCLRNMVNDNSISLEKSYFQAPHPYQNANLSSLFLAGLSTTNPVEQLLLPKYDNPSPTILPFSPDEVTNEYDMIAVFNYIFFEQKDFLSPKLRTKNLGDNGPGPRKRFVHCVLDMNRQFLKGILFNNTIYQVPAFMMHRRVGTILAASIVRALSLEIRPEIPLPPFFFDLISHADSLPYVERHFYMLYSKDMEAFKTSIIQLVLNKHPQAESEPDSLLRFDFPTLNSSDKCFGFNNPWSPYEISRSIPSELEDDETWMYPPYTYKTLIGQYIPSMEQLIITEFQEYLKLFKSVFFPRNLQVLSYFPQQSLIAEALNSKGRRTELLNNILLDNQSNNVVSSMIPNKTYPIRNFIEIFYELIPEDLIPKFYEIVTGSSGAILHTKKVIWKLHDNIPSKSNYQPDSVYGNVVTQEIVNDLMTRLFEYEKKYLGEPDATMPPLPEFFPAMIYTCHHTIHLHGVESSAQILLALLFHFNCDQNYFYRREREQ